MQKATATYHAPEGDNKVVEMGGVTFFDGQAVELNSDDHSHLINKFEGNPHFEIDVGKDDGAKDKNSNPRAHDVKESFSEATGHDFEHDRQHPKRGRPAKTVNVAHEG